MRHVILVIDDKRNLDSIAFAGIIRQVFPALALLDAPQPPLEGTLNHPNIVSVLTVGTERGVHYYAMQLVEGQSLAEVSSPQGGTLLVPLHRRRGGVRGGGRPRQRRPNHRA